jgi:hypothetical protein
MITLYHTTLAARVSSIVQDGLRPGRRPQWRNAMGGRIVDPTRLYAWTLESSALLWAAKMRWEFGPAIKRPERLCGARIVLPGDIRRAIRERDAAWGKGLNDTDHQLYFRGTETTTTECTPPRGEGQQ